MEKKREEELFEKYLEKRKWSAYYNLGLNKPQREAFRKRIENTWSYQMYLLKVQLKELWRAIKRK